MSSLMRQLEKIANTVRLKLERVNFADELNKMKLLRVFPVGCCQTATNIFLYYLMDRRIVHPAELFLLANAEITEGCTHAWARVGEYHVDITADQFGKKKVIIASFNPWPSIHRAPTEYCFAEERFNPEYEDDLKRMAAYVHESDDQA